MTASLKASADGLSASLQVGGVDKAVINDSGLAQQIISINASVNANALTVTINPCSLTFRSSTGGSGTVYNRSIASAISCTVPSTATLGTINATAARLAILAIDNAGTVEAAIVNLAGGNDLSETGLISTTALSGSSNSASTIYSTTARTNVPYRVVGFIDITEATAGTWAAAPSLIQGAGGNAITSMQSLGHGQTWQDVTGSRALGTTYYNTTGKPIMVVARSNLTTGVELYFTVNGVETQRNYVNTATSSSYAGVTTIVPPGGSYVLSGTSWQYWAELR